VHLNPLGALTPGTSDSLLDLALKYPRRLVTHLISPEAETYLMVKSTYHIASVDATGEMPKAQLNQMFSNSKHLLHTMPAIIL
jgi:hypothetical protein